ncbi:MAG: 30S ribosomal protein S7 [Candidatus Aceula meridiana]|nr:30S ribosomal protein S7 [Candidatus Aceula meridiana]
MRRHRAEKRSAQIDPKYKSQLVAGFIGMMMLEGKKTLAERIVYRALDILKKKTNEEDVLKAFGKSVENVRPKLQVKSRRVGGSTYQIPMEVSPLKGNSIALRWMRDLARKKKGKPMEIKLAEELFAAFKGEGPAVKKRDETHKMAEANKAFAHLKW